MREPVQKIDMVNMSVTNKCNLKCPSCPTGRLNANLARNGKRAVVPSFTPVEMCEKIFEKVRQLYGPQLFYLHIWGEPLLHPRMADILHLLDQYGHMAYMSSNLNVRADWTAIMAQPALRTLVVSMSGYDQTTYEKGHRGGRVALVLENLKTISQLLPRSQARVLINFHSYNDNEADALALQELCGSLGIEFGPYPAVALQENVEAAVASGRHEAWRQIPDIADLVIPRLKLRPFPFTDIAGLEGIPCHSQSNILVLDHAGRICTCTHREPTVVQRLGNFLEMDEATIRQVKASAPSCQKCRQLGLHMSYVFACFFEKPCDSEQEIVDFLAAHAPLARFADESIYIFGAGMTGAAVGPLLRHHGYDVRGFIDDDPQKTGKSLHGIDVYPLEEAAPMLAEAWVLDTVRSLPFRRRAAAAGISCRAILSSEEFIATIMKEQG